jgi:AcrR family transcriptional regulator
MKMKPERTGGKTSNIAQERQKRRNKLSVDQKMLLAMEQLLLDGEEFSSTTVDRLAEAAGISRASFYLNYRDKADLVTHLFDEVQSEIIAAAGQWFKNAGSTTYPDIRKSLAGILGVYRDHYVILSAMQQTALTNMEVAERWQLMKNQLCRASIKALGQLREGGSAHPGASDLGATLLTLAINHVSVTESWLLNPEKFEATCDAWAHIAWRALAAP